MITDGRAKGWWPKGGDIWVGLMQFLRACGARPLYLMHEYQVPWLCEYHVHVGVPSTPPVPVPQYPPYPCPVRTPRGRGRWWYGDDEGCWVRVR